MLLTHDSERAQDTDSNVIVQTATYKQYKGALVSVIFRVTHQSTVQVFIDTKPTTVPVPYC